MGNYLRCRRFVSKQTSRGFCAKTLPTRRKKILLKKNIPNGVSLVEYILQKLALKLLVSRFCSECTNVSGLTGGGCDFELCVSGLFPTSLKAFLRNHSSAGQTIEMLD